MKYLQWIPVSCRRPDDELEIHKAIYMDETYVEVIGLIEGAEEPTALGYDGSGFFWIDPHESEEDDPDRMYFTVTHWMSFPPPPWKCLVDLDLGDQIEANFEMLEVILT